MVARERLRLGVLISGSGTNLQAIIDASADGSLEADVAVVVSNVADAFGLERARRAGIPAVFLDRDAFGTGAEYSGEIVRVLREHGVGLVVMAGYMRLLGSVVLDAFPGAVLNIHPALLPSFPGAHGIADAFAYGVKVAGVTVHFASAVFDEGPILAQGCVEVAEDDTLETLEAKLHAVEHKLYPLAIQAIASGSARVDGRKVHIVPEV
ncbi:MAG: phosphoribosylglycinamide formyltransferase [Coriobacteriia bacterium]